MDADFLDLRNKITCQSCFYRLFSCPPPNPSKCPKTLVLKSLLSWYSQLPAERLPLPQHPELLKAGKQLLVSSNGLPALNVFVFRPEATEAVILVASVNSTHPSAILPVRAALALWGRGTGSETLLFITLLSCKKIMHLKKPFPHLLVKFSAAPRAGHGIIDHLEGFLGNGSQDLDLRYGWLDQKTFLCEELQHVVCFPPCC